MQEGQGFNMIPNNKEQFMLFLEEQGVKKEFLEWVEGTKMYSFILFHLGNTFADEIVIPELDFRARLAKGVTITKAEEFTIELLLIFYKGYLGQRNNFHHQNLLGDKL